MARRFIVKESDMIELEANLLRITGPEMKHIKVLRHKVDDHININNYICKILKINEAEILVERINKAKTLGEPDIEVDFYQAFLKSDKMDFVVQKLVELGIKKIDGFFSKNVVVKLDDKSKLKRKEKLQKVADEACKQCGRTDKVEVLDFIDFQGLLGKLNEYSLVLFAYENEKDAGLNELKNVLSRVYDENLTNISVIIGSEGGFTEDEAKKISSLKNVKTISLGERILRAETASIYLASIINYELSL